MSGQLFRQPSRTPRSRRSIQPGLENLEERCLPAILQVGAGLTYQTIAQAAAAAQNGDTIQIQAGTYTSQEAIFTQSNLTIKGVGGAVIFNDQGYQLQNEKGIFDIRGNNDTVQGITFEYAHDMSGQDGDNFAGIRGEGNTLTIENCSFFHNDDGILINNDPNFQTDNNDLLVTNSEFAYNGYGDGESHNMYIGEITSFTLEYSYSHDANQGHDVKSRALNTYLLYNYISDGPTGGGSSEIDIPYGGNAYLIGNVIEKDANAANHNFLTFDLENGPSTYAQQLDVVNNTFVNDYGGGTYLEGNTSNPASVLLENNIFAGGGSISNVAYNGVTNLATNNPGFQSWTPGTDGGNYQLAAGSPAIGAGTQPGSANGFSLVPTEEYVAPLSSQARPVENPIDIGAYAYGTTQTAPAAPTGLTATAGNDQVALAWNASSGATGYDIYRGTTSGGESTTPIATDVSGTSFTDSNVSDGTTYYYEVTALNGTLQSGDSNQASATPQQVTQQSATALTSSANPSVYGQTITLTATVSAGSGTPTGSVTFYNGSTSLGAASLNNGVATLNVTFTTVGSDSLTAAYSGNSNFQASSSAALSQTVHKAASQVAIASSVASSVLGQSVTFTATVSAVSPGSGTPTGTVTFYNGSTVLGTASLSNGVAHFTTSGLTVGSHTIKATYGGNADFTTSSKSISQPVKKDSTKLTASPTSATVNQAVTLTAKVAVASPGSGTPTGTVKFTDATTGTVLGTATLVNGTATLTNVVFTTAVTHKISVSYSGDGDDLASSLTLLVKVLA